MLASFGKMILRESVYQGHHTRVFKQVSYMILFIVSEMMLF
jgi:hypothetical protein